MGCGAAEAALRRALAWPRVGPQERMPAFRLGSLLMDRISEHLQGQGDLKGASASAAFAGALGCRLSDGSLAPHLFSNFELYREEVHIEILERHGGGLKICANGPLDLVSCLCGAGRVELMQQLLTSLNTVPFPYPRRLFSLGPSWGVRLYAMAASPGLPQAPERAEGHLQVTPYGSHDRIQLLGSSHWRVAWTQDNRRYGNGRT
jgi:hypothetical protein